MSETHYKTYVKSMPERYFGVSEHSKPSKNHYNVCQNASAVLHFSEDGINLTEPMSKCISKNEKNIAKTTGKQSPNQRPNRPLT